MAMKQLSLWNRFKRNRLKHFVEYLYDVNGFARDDAPAFLVDASVKGLYGGSGVTADWDGAAELAKKYPLLLAGGLTPENVAEAVGRVKPWGVDVASGVESAPGKKDPSKMKAFVQAIKRLEN